MLTDVLATVVAFASAMLLFSLLVTAGVQAIHAVCQFRYHNLNVGMQVFLEEFCRDAYIDNGTVKESVKESVNYLLSIRKAKAVLPVPVRPEAVEVADLQDALRRAFDGVIDEKSLSDIERSMLAHFRRAELFMVQRFQRISNALAIAIGLLIAITYQINTPELLRKLSVDPAYRETLIHHVDTGAASVTDDPLISQLKETQNVNRAEQVQSNVTSAALLDFQIMPNGIDYYFDFSQGYAILENYIGVFISGILISLGAPFWFNNLKVLFSLRARLKQHT